MDNRELVSKLIDAANAIDKYSRTKGADYVVYSITYVENFKSFAKLNSFRDAKAIIEKYHNGECNSIELSTYNKYVESLIVEC